MSALIISLRIFSLAIFAGPMLMLGISGKQGTSSADAARARVPRAPLLANLTAFAVFLPTLVFFGGNADGRLALTLAISGSFLAVVGVAVIFVSRAKLGAAWSLLPRAGEMTGLVTTGPYRFVRHPIYLGLTLLVTGQALSFGSYVSILIVVLAIVPSFAWRAYTEEALLAHTFGQSYAAYRQRTRAIIPFLL